MSITFEQVKQRLLSDPGFEVLDPPWTDDDFRQLKEATGCTPPPQLEKILREFGSFAIDFNNYFLAVFETGEILKSEIQIPVTGLEFMISSFRSLRQSTEFPNRFPFDMIFFGSADAGHSELLMHSAEKNDGSVYLWPVTGIPWGEEGNHRGLGKVSDSLYDFLYYMTDYDNI